MDSVKEDDVDVLASVTLPPSTSSSNSARRPFTVDVPLPSFPPHIHANPDSHPLSDAPDPQSSAAVRHLQAAEEAAAAAASSSSSSSEDQNQQRPFNVATHRPIVHTLYGDRPTLEPEDDPSSEIEKESETKYDDSIPRVAVVIGASRDLGFAITRLLLHQRPENLHVVLCARQEKAATAAASLLIEEGYSHVTPFAVDICDESSVALLVEMLKREFPQGVDYLINNASLREVASPSSSSSSSASAAVIRMMSTNFFSALHLTEVFLPLMNTSCCSNQEQQQQQHSPKIIHVSCSVVNHTFRSFHSSIQSTLTGAELTIPQLCILMQQYLDALEDGTAARKYGFGAWVAFGVSKIGVMQFMRIFANHQMSIQDEKKSGSSKQETSSSVEDQPKNRRKILFAVADPGQWAPAASTTSIADSVASFTSPAEGNSTSSSSSATSPAEAFTHIGVVSTALPRGQRSLAVCAKSVVDCCHLPDDAEDGVMRYEGREVPLK